MLVDIVERCSLGPRLTSNTYYCLNSLLGKGQSISWKIIGIREVNLCTILTQTPAKSPPLLSLHKRNHAKVTLLPGWLKLYFMTLIIFPLALTLNCPMLVRSWIATLFFLLYTNAIYVLAGRMNDGYKHCVY